MAKKYLEIIEQLSDEEALTQWPQTIRLEVKDEQEAVEKAAIHEGIFKNLNINYKKYFHTHRLNEEEGCVVKDLEKSKL